MSKHQIALLGAGRIAQVHAKNISQHPDCHLVAVVDPIAEAAQRVVEQYGGQVTSLDAVLQDPQIKGVAIATSTDTHADLIKTCARAGKTIFCEKPVDLDLQRVRDCLHTVEQAKVPLQIGFNRRYDPHFAKLREDYRQGRIGKGETLLLISRDPAPPSVQFIARSGGFFRDMTIHDFDMAYSILQEEPMAITAVGSCLVDPQIGKCGDVDTSTVLLHYQSGKQVIIMNSRRSHFGYDMRIELHGEKGLLRVGNVLENQVEYWGQNHIQTARAMDFFPTRFAEAFRLQWRHFVDVLEGKTSPWVSGRDGERALLLADAAQKSFMTKTTVHV